MPHGISLHIALKNSNCYYLVWDSSINQPASTTAGPSCKPAHHIIITPLQQALFHATSCVSPSISDALLRTSAPLPSPFAATLIQWRLRPFSYLASHPKTLTQVIMTEICHNKHTHRSISAPRQRCCANSQRIWKGLTTLLSLLLITDRDAFFITSVLLPSSLSARLP